MKKDRKDNRTNAPETEEVKATATEQDDGAIDAEIVTASYRVGDHSNGTLGIIGPTRMNYNRVISVLDFMGRALSDVLSEYR